MKVRLKFKLADFWIGVFWKWSSTWLECSTLHPFGELPVKDHKCDPGWATRLDLWICLVPCFPLHIEIERRDGWEPKSNF